MKPRFALLLALACAGSLSCGNDRVFAPRVPLLDIRMDLTASSPGSGVPVTIKAVVKNAGSISFGHVNMCPVPVIRIYDGQNVELLQLDPTMGVVCPLMLPAPIRFNESVEFSHVFDGTYFSATGVRLDAPPGTYRAVATFEYRTMPESGGPGVPGTVVRETSFVWQ